MTSSYEVWQWSMRTGDDISHGLLWPLFEQGSLKWDPFLGGCKCTVIFRDFPYNSAVFIFLPLAPTPPEN